MKNNKTKQTEIAVLLEGIHPRAVDIFEEQGFKAELLKEALDEQTLIDKLDGVSILCIRSKTQVTKKVLQARPNLACIGAFCIGTDQIELESCSSSGVAVFNAPYSNTRSVVELALGEIILLLRRTFELSTALHQGRWSKTASGSFEVRGKKLGIIGYGNIGSQLSVLAEGLGLEVLYYDITEKLGLGNAKRCKTLEDLLKNSEIVTVHVDGRPQNKHLISSKQFAQMRDGVIFLNLSRGNVVDLEALAAACKSAKVAGAAVDVFPREPASNDQGFDSPLKGLPNVILTPHVGGSTLEAQRNIAEFVSERLISYIKSGSTHLSVNFPQLQLPELIDAHRFLHVHENVPGILAKINGLLAERGINILGQYLKTSEQIGYVITDVDSKYERDVIKELEAINHTIRFRALY